MESETKIGKNTNNENEIETKFQSKGETTFNKLKNLQTLLKKESALKGLYAETGKNTQKDIEILCKEIYSKKIEVLNVLKNESSINNEIHYQLIENNKEYLKDLNLYIPKLLAYLWENPSLIAKLLIKSKVDEVKTFLAPLICNNFYENILSPNYIEDQLLYVIYLLLEDEIDKLNDLSETNKFLNNTVCGYLLSELIDKKDIKAFFKIILKDIIEIMELSHGDIKLVFEASGLEKNIVQRKQTISRLTKAKTFTPTIIDSQKQRSNEEKKMHEDFFTNYLIDLTLQELSELKNKYISEKNEKMKDYIEHQLNLQKRRK